MFAERITLEKNSVTIEVDGIEDITLSAAHDELTFAMFAELAFVAERHDDTIARSLIRQRQLHEAFGYADEIDNI